VKTQSKSSKPAKSKASTKAPPAKKTTPAKPKAIGSKSRATLDKPKVKSVKPKAKVIKTKPKAQKRNSKPVIYDKTVAKPKAKPLKTKSKPAKPKKPVKRKKHLSIASPIITLQRIQIISVKWSPNRNFIRIVKGCNSEEDLGLICPRRQPSLWLKNQVPDQPYLVGQIPPTEAKTFSPYKARRGSTPCGGSNYQGGKTFSNLGEILLYIENFANVRIGYCPGSEDLLQVYYKATGC
jgi:hypothetical protein